MLKKISQSLLFIWKYVRYNLKIIFANKFIYFLLAAIVIFLFIIFLSLVDEDSNPTAAIFYYWLLVPGILLVFYPSVFGIQNDVDSRMLEILFGVPNYRYKVWLVRLGVIYIIVFALLWILAFAGSMAIVMFNISEMVFQVMFPVFFLGSVAFLFSTWVRNGYGTAVVMVVIALIFWILSGELVESRWNLFLNPFHYPEEVSELAWGDIITKNRIYLSVGIVVSILMGLLNLQKREKFV